MLFTAAFKSGLRINNVVALPTLVPAAETSIRWFSDSNKKGSSSRSFRPRRRASRNYRPVKAGVRKQKDWAPGNDHKFVDLGNVKVDDPVDELDLEFGPLAAGIIRDRRKEVALRGLDDEDAFEKDLRMADYLTAAEGSTEDLVATRRGLARGFEDPNAGDKYLEDIDEMIRKGQMWNMGLHKEEKWFPEEQPRDPFAIDEGDDEDDGEDKDTDITMDPNQLAHGEWAEMLVRTDRNTKLWRGGRLESYRVLVIGGNMNGCGGFGIGKAQDPTVALEVASRKCKRNIFFVDRYQGNGLTRDLVGKQNSCKVFIRATDNGLRGNELCREILKRFGITNAVIKSYGNRNVYNVVRACFKALMTHESMEDIALKRGKRISSIDRAMRMQI